MFDCVLERPRESLFVGASTSSPLTGTDVVWNIQIYINVANILIVFCSKVYLKFF